MDSHSLKRIQNQLQTFDPTENDFKVRLVNNNYWHWKGFIHGPHDTSYEGALFLIDIHIPREYPFKPPKMRFENKVWHPNISSVTGAICLDILFDQWSPALTIRTTLLSLQALLCCPNPQQPQDAVVAAEMNKSLDIFNQHVKEWVATYASQQYFANKVKFINQMGFSPEEAQEALIYTGYDEERALNLLLYKEQ